MLGFSLITTLYLIEDASRQNEVLMSGRGRSGNKRFTQKAYDFGDEISGIGVALAMGLGGVVLAISPSYLGFEWASIYFDVVLSLAISLWFWSTMGFLLELGEIKKFMSGMNEQGWEYLLASCAFLVPAGALYAVVRLVEILPLIEVPIKLASTTLAVIGTFFVAAALDFFFIQPRLKNIPKARSGVVNPRSGLGSVATAITWLLANAANALVIVGQLFPGG